MYKKIGIGVALLVAFTIIILSALAFWLTLVLPSEAQQQQTKQTKASDLHYLQKTVDKRRGRIIAVVSSVRQLGDTGKTTGFDLMELARAYWVFQVNGFDVDVASPLGGEPLALLDDEDMGAFDYAFMNDSVAMGKIKKTLTLSDVNPSEYDAIYFVGGKGAMFDFPDNKHIQTLAAHFANNDKVIAAICHGPSALVNVKTEKGEWLIANKSISSFTNSEELLLKPNAKSIFPFLLQSRLEERGGNFEAGPDYLQHISIEDGLVTAQNPWSTWAMAEEVIKQLGYTPVTREPTNEENSLVLMEVFHQKGLSAAEGYVRNHEGDYSRWLILMHAIVAIMKGELIEAGALVILTDGLKET